MDARGRRQQGRGRARVGALAAVAALFLASSAGAFPIVFDGPGGFGVSASTAADVQAAGFSLITNTPVYSGSLFNLVIPAPNVLSFQLVQNPTVANPNTAQSLWSVTNGGDAFLDNAWLVFFTPLTYPPASVGINLPSGGQWALVDVPVGEGDYFYPAVFLGDLDSGDTATFLMNHIVGVPLTQQGDTLVLPQYQVGLLQGVPVPEPGTFALVAAGVALAAALRVRKD